MDMDIYKKKGYKDRKEYLDELAKEYDIPNGDVYELASLFGPSEDFDGLISMLEDYQYLI